MRGARRLVLLEALARKGKATFAWLNGNRVADFNTICLGRMKPSVYALALNLDKCKASLRLAELSQPNDAPLERHCLIQSNIYNTTTHRTV